MSIINQAVSSKAGEKASEYLLSSNDGVQARKRTSIIFMIVGVCWILLMLGANWIASSAPEPNPMSAKMLIILIGIGAISILYGLIQIILLKTSVKFREWSNKDYAKAKNKISEIEGNTSKQLKIVFITLTALIAIVAIIYLILMLSGVEFV